MSKNIVSMLPQVLALSLGVAATAAAQSKLPDVSRLAVPAGTTAGNSLLASSRGEMRIVVRLAGQPLGAVAGNKRSGKVWSASKQQAHLATLAAQQDAVMSQVKALGGVELARVSKAHNALIVSIDAKKVPDLTKITGVAGVRRLIDYELSLSETVPYIGATAAHTAGVDGAGVRVAVLDSGIDFTHKNLGGAGTIALYDQCYAGFAAAPVGDCANLFGAGAPKVVGGYDFVGETWPNGARSDDPNPIALKGTGGHGTHVADIIAGKSADGMHVGVAPGASLYGVKVCSAVASSCNGIALLKGMDFAMDPNGDGNIADAVDVINMSLGSSYGQREDDLSAATSIASKFGIVVVVSAGNSADRPFITGSPSSTPEAISVAQTQVPSASTFGVQVDSPAGIAGLYKNTATLDWAPVGAGFTGQVKTALQAGGANNQACAALPAGSLAGFVALVDRGTCAVSDKVNNAANAGAAGVLVMLVAAGDAISFSFGTVGPFTAAPSLVIQQSLGNSIKANLAAPVMVTVSNATKVLLVGGVVGSSSRGPSYSYGAIKPEIGAPGASVSAEVGTGDGEIGFGGTSGAAPMVAGSAALVLQKSPKLLPHEVKARLMHGAETDVYTNPSTQPGVLAPITRIGSGEVRVNRSLELTTGAWDAADPAGVALSFGSYRSTGMSTYRKKVLVRNYANTARSYAIASSFRYADDAASGAVSISAPATVAVPADGSATFLVTMQVDASKLPTWALNGGFSGGNGALLNLPEYDGYLTLTEGAETVHLPWHILPHKSASVIPSSTSLALNGTGSGPLTLSNTAGARDGRFDVFVLDATSDKLPAAFQPRPGDNYAIIDLKSVGSRLVNTGASGLGVQFAIDTWGQRSHPNYPAEMDVYIDTNNDGNWDFIAYTVENTGFAATGQNLTVLLNLSNNAAVPRFFTDADLVSSSTIMTVLLGDLGITDATKISYLVAAFDNYFTGALTDLSDVATLTLGARRFGANTAGVFTVPAGGSIPVTVLHNPAGDAASPTDKGLLLMYRDGKVGAESSAITVSP